MEQQLQIQSEHYKELEAANHQIRRIQHDLKNFISIASSLAEQENDNTELIAFLNKTSGQIMEIERVISTGNTYLDSILNIKISEMLYEKIRIETNIQIPSGIELTFEQSVIIFGNLLENAKEACRSLPEDRRWVKLKLSFNNHALLIRIENASEQIITWKNDLPLTTKNDSIFHGIGLKNIKRTIDEIGTMKIETLPHSFLVSIVLYDL